MTLDEAWRMAEAALPKGMRVEQMERRSDGGWYVIAVDGKRLRTGSGRTLARALSVLAERLRSGTPGEEQG